MKRRPDWLVRFNAALDAHRPHPFTWGSHDCGILAADCIKAITGKDIARNFRGRYRSAESARAFLAAAGYRTAVDVVAKHFRRVSHAAAQVGDIAVVMTEDGPALAPVIGSEVAVFSPRDGLGFLPLEAACRAYRIGEG